MCWVLRQNYNLYTSTSKIISIISYRWTVSVNDRTLIKNRKRLTTTTTTTTYTQLPWSFLSFSFGRICYGIRLQSHAHTQTNIDQMSTRGRHRLNCSKKNSNCIDNTRIQLFFSLLLSKMLTMLIIYITLNSPHYYWMCIAMEKFDCAQWLMCTLAQITFWIRLIDTSYRQSIHNIELKRRESYDSRSRALLVKHLF